jgi:hypothetical protein
MYYVLLDVTGNLIASYRDEEEARAALDRLIEDDPGAAEEIALMTYDDEGALAADPVFVVLTESVMVSGESKEEWYSRSPLSELSSERTEGRSAVPAGA